ncbi:MAG: ABC transporter permease subunit [Nocardioidaceae bacterium]|nr:ABC transporter permease subunit [Nocardioidaceae bacterium]
MTPAGRAGRAVFWVFLVTWFLLPLVPLALWAATETWTGTTRLPQEWGVQGFTDTFADGGAAALLRSLALGCVVGALATPAGAVAARALTLRTVPWPRLVSALLIAPVALPAFAVVMGLDVVLLRLHAPGKLGIVLVLVVASLPYTTYLMRLAYSAYDFAFEDEARTLGASQRAVLWRVRLPLLAPGLAAAAFLAFLVGWSDYIVTLLIGGGRFVTLPVLVASAASGTGNEPTVAALSITALMPPFLALVAAGVLRRSFAPRMSRVSSRPTPSDAFRHALPTRGAA